jgi:hypothetical protein
MLLCHFPFVCQIHPPLSGNPLAFLILSHHRWHQY